MRCCGAENTIVNSFSIICNSPFKKTLNVNCQWYSSLRVHKFAQVIHITNSMNEMKNKTGLVLFSVRDRGEVFFGDRGEHIRKLDRRRAWISEPPPAARELVSFQTNFKIEPLPLRTLTFH